LKLKVKLEIELQLATYDSYTISLPTAEGAYRVVTLCVQLARDLFAVTKFLV